MVKVLGAFTQWNSGGTTDGGYVVRISSLAAGHGTLCPWHWTNLYYGRRLGTHLTTSLCKTFTDHLTQHCILLLRFYSKICRMCVRLHCRHLLLGAFPIASSWSILLLMLNRQHKSWRSCLCLVSRLEGVTSGAPFGGQSQNDAPPNGASLRNNLIKSQTKDLASCSVLREKEGVTHSTCNGQRAPPHN